MNIPPRIIIAGVTALALTGCCSTKSVEVVSDPPGARVIVNGDYIGDAPVTIPMIKQAGFSHRYEIEAIPTPPMEGIASGNVLLRTVSTSRGIPERVFFDMRLRALEGPEVETGTVAR